MFKDVDLPQTAMVNGNVVIVDRGKDEAGRFYRLTTAQSNGWLKVNHYYEDGTVTETYKR